MNESTPPWIMTLEEWEQEHAVTAAVLAAIPADQLDWRPHAKSMTLGQLGMHIATCSAAVLAMTDEPATAAETMMHAVEDPESLEAILAAHAQTLETVRARVQGWDAAGAAASWSLTKGGEPIMTMPRMAVFRVIGANHVYHHRGQLTVYLRLLDVPLPSVYGPSADVNPMA